MLITLSNILVQYPFELWGYHTTWGAFTYPAIFILTDLNARLSNAKMARRIIICSMLPALIISYGLASYIEMQPTAPWSTLLQLHLVPFRVASACFVAYVVGQLLDIQIFQKLRSHPLWWVAPVFSTTIGNVVDTLLFFVIAFYHSSNVFLNAHWMEIAGIDIVFKILISLFAFIPVYGWVLSLFTKRKNILSGQSLGQNLKSDYFFR